MNIAVILAGGVGSRMGCKVPKQYLSVNGKTILQYCLEKFVQHPDIDRLLICVADQWHSFVDEICQKMGFAKPYSLSQAGASRQETIFNALQTLKIEGIAADDILVIHDAVRPLVSMQLISDCIARCKNADGALPVIPVKDTIYQSNDGKSISNLLNRDTLFAGQAPESFRFGKYYAIHQNLTIKQLAEVRGSSEIAYRNGLTINLFHGDVMNFKITTAEDLSNFEKIVENES